MEKGNIIKISRGHLTEISKGDYVASAKSISSNAAHKITENSKEGIFFGEPKKMNGIKDDSVDVVVGVFFDGTRNNKTNNELRVRHELNSKIPTKGLEGQDSYQNAPSNVQILSKVAVINTLHRSIYIEGVATNNNAKDKSVAAGLGYFETGIRDKVKSGCQSLATLIAAIINTEGLKVNKITIDVFGFSRGATCARNFIYEITKPEQETPLFRDGRNKNGIYYSADGTKRANTKIVAAEAVKTMQPARGMLGQYLSDKRVKFSSFSLRFGGLFDSVSSYGLMHRNDVWELDLNAINKMAHIVHLTAADERRDNFELTAVTKGITKNLPGVHSDIGGGYRDHIVDKFLVKANNKERVLVALDPKIESERKRLIEQAWYTKEQFTLEGSQYEPTRLFGTRRIRNNYSYIPLHLMAEFAMSIGGVKFNINILNKDFKIAEDDPKLNLRKVYERLYKYAFKNAPPMLYFTEHEIELLRKKVYEGLLSKEKFAMLANDHNMLRQLRSRYLHNSADFGDFGMEPTWDNERVIYNQKKP